MAELTLEHFEDVCFRREEILERLKDASPEEAQVLNRQLRTVENVLNAVSDEEMVQDDLIAKWEREIAEGKTPDLEER